MPVAISIANSFQEPALPEPEQNSKQTGPRIKFAGYSMAVPGSKPLRILLGVVLVIGGLLGFLPVLGFWMVPLGLLILSIDLGVVRKFRRRVEVWWGRRQAARRAAKEAAASK